MATLNGLRQISLLTLYRELFEHFGPRHWWPAETPFEVIIGAILTQNTAWKNVENTLNNLKQRDLLAPERLAALSRDELADVIRSSGYFNQKAIKIKAFLEYYNSKYQYKLELMAQESLDNLRAELLEVYGIGEETADSILLYALEKPTFVVDAYTKRILSRMGFVPESISYRELKNVLESSVPGDVTLYNEYHALLVKLGHDICLSKPKCTICPVKSSCRYYHNNTQ